MTTLTTTPIKPYIPLHLKSFPAALFKTQSGVEIHPMWSGEGNLSYLVVNPKTRDSFVIDPDLEILGSYLLTLEMQQLKLVAAMDTHNHAEHSTAAPELKRLLGVEYIIVENAPSSEVTRRITDNEELFLAGIPVRFLHTPGHTPDLASVLVENHLFTGDSLFLKSCGRADFPVSDPGIQFETLQRLKHLPDDILIHPGHDYNNELTLTLGESKRINKRLQFTDKTEFVRFMDEYYKNEEKPDDWEWYVAYNAR